MLRGGCGAYNRGLVPSGSLFRHAAELMPSFVGPRRPPVCSENGADECAVLSYPSKKFHPRANIEFASSPSLAVSCKACCKEGFMCFLWNAMVGACSDLGFMELPLHHREDGRILRRGIPERPRPSHPSLKV